MAIIYLRIGTGQAGVENELTVEVTPDMLAAGWEQVELCGPDSRGFATDPEWIARLYRAMKSCDPTWS